MIDRGSQAARYDRLRRYLMGDMNPDAPEKAEPEKPEFTFEPCACRTCRMNDPRDKAEIEEHAFYHGEFAVYISVRNGSHGFTELRPERVAEIKLQEHFAEPLSGVCDWPEHATYPRHGRAH